MKYAALLALTIVTIASTTAATAAQTLTAARTDRSPVAAPAGGIAVPADYVLGPDDVISVVFWRDKDLSADVVIRPDGKISLALLNDVQAAGYTPDQLRLRLIEAASKFIEDPTASVVVKEIHSRKVFITGNVAKAGEYRLTDSMNVIQLIAIAGGLFEYADAKKILVLRNEDGKTTTFKFNYKDVLAGKNPQQNITLHSGDTVIVP